MVDISIYGWNITTSGLKKQTSTILEFYFRFRSRPFPRYLHFILHQPAEFRPNRSSHCGNMMSYRFIKMAAAGAQYYFRFRICWYRCLQKVKVYQQTKFRRHISIDGWDNIIPTSVSGKTNVRHIEILLPVSISTTSRNFHVILHHATKFSPNRSTHCRNMTSYPFLKMAAATVKYYFRFRICWCHCLQKEKVKVYQQTKFCRIISIDGWDITTSVFKKNKRPPYWKSTSDFDFDHLAVICILFCIRLPNFVQIGAPRAEIWRHIHFSRWRPRPLYTTSGFVFVDVTAFSLSANQISSRIEISQLAAEI